MIEIRGREEYHIAFSSLKSVWHDVHATQGTLIALLTRELARRGFLYTDISRLAVVMGSGTFTSTRIAAVYANMFRLVTRTVIGVTRGDFFQADAQTRESLWDAVAWNGYVSPAYMSEPHITVPRKK